MTSGAGGGFSITHDYNCPSATSQVYLVASGGNPCLSAGTNNTALALMAALGPCGQLNGSTFVDIDEVTTVASVYALAQFMTAGGGANLGASMQRAGSSHRFRHRQQSGEYSERDGARTFPARGSTRPPAN